MSRVETIVQNRGWRTGETGERSTSFVRRQTDEMLIFSPHQLRGIPFGRRFFRNSMCLAGRSPPPPFPLARGRSLLMESGTRWIRLRAHKGRSFLRINITPPPLGTRHFHYFSHYGLSICGRWTAGKTARRGNERTVGGGGRLGEREASIKFEYGNIGIPRLYRLNVLPLPPFAFHPREAWPERFNSRSIRVLLATQSCQPCEPLKISFFPRSSRTITVGQFCSVSVNFIHRCVSKYSSKWTLMRFRGEVTRELEPNFDFFRSLRRQKGEEEVRKSRFHRTYHEQNYLSPLVKLWDNIPV